MKQTFVNRVKAILFPASTACRKQLEALDEDTQSLSKEVTHFGSRVAIITGSPGLNPIEALAMRLNGHERQKERG